MSQCLKACDIIPPWDVLCSMCPHNKLKIPVQASDCSVLLGCNYFTFLSFLIFAPQKRHGTYVHMNAQRVEEMRTNCIGYFTANLERAVDKCWSAHLMLTLQLCQGIIIIICIHSGLGQHLHMWLLGQISFHIYIDIVFPPHIVHKERPLLLCLSFVRPSSLYNTINWCYCNTPRAARLQRLLPPGLLSRVFPELKGDGWLWNSKTDWKRCLFEVGKMD